METVNRKPRSRRRIGKGPFIVNSGIVDEFVGVYAAQEHAASLNAQSSAVAQYTVLLIAVVYAILAW